LYANWMRLPIAQQEKANSETLDCANSASLP